MKSKPKRKTYSDRERLTFYHGVILRFDPRSDDLYRARQVYYGRRTRTLKAFLAAIDAAITASKEARKMKLALGLVLGLSMSLAYGFAFGDHSNVSYRISFYNEGAGTDDVMVFDFTKKTIWVNPKYKPDEAARQALKAMRVMFENGPCAEVAEEARK